MYKCVEYSRVYTAPPCTRRDETRQDETRRDEMDRAVWGWQFGGGAERQRWPTAAVLDGSGAGRQGSHTRGVADAGDVAGAVGAGGAAGVVGAAGAGGAAGAALA